MKPSVFGLAVAAWAACAAAAPGQLFHDVTTQMNCEFVQVPTPGTGGLGSGAALFDYDGDGDDDLLCVNANGLHRLLRYDGGGFTNVTAGSGLTNASNKTYGVAIGDYDDDGQPDVLFANVGPNNLLRNDAGVFTDVTAQVGITGEARSTGGAWADFDRDGDLDLYVGNYIQVFSYPFQEGWPNELWRNDADGDGVLFVEIAAAAGVDDVGVFPPPPPGYANPKEGQPVAGCTFSISTVDIDDDGDADILVGNDFGEFVRPNQLYRNDTPRGGPLAFTNVSAETGFDAVPQYNMGIHAADYDRDGDWDVYCSDLGDNALLRNDGGVFTDVVYEAGPVDGVSFDGQLLRSSWGTVWADVDNDGWEDLYVVNGHIPGTAPQGQDNEYQSPNSLWINQGGGTFEYMVPIESGLANFSAGRGAVWSDFDGDGGLEIWLANNGTIWLPDGSTSSGAKSRMYRSRPNAKNHWAQFRLVGTRSNKEALGARVDLDIGGRVMRRQVRDDSVYMTSPSRLVHFGLGTAHTIDKLTIRWPSGTVQELLDLPTDVRRTIEEPDTVFASAPAFDETGRALSIPLANLADAARAYRLSVRTRDDGSVGAVGLDGVLGPLERRTLTLPVPALHALRLELQNAAGEAIDARNVPVP